MTSPDEILLRPAGPADLEHLKWAVYREISAEVDDVLMALEL